MDLMLDIETLGLEPMSVITQIAAVPFEIEDDSLNYGINIDINLNNCLNNGAIIDGNTLTWTIENNLQALKNQNEKMDLPEALLKLGWYIGDIRPQFIWAKSPNFDCTILESWYKRCGITIPWKYKQLVDVRTIEWFGRTKLNLGEVLDEIHEKYKGKTHNPTADCHFQIEVLRKVINRRYLTVLSEAVE